MPAPTKPKAPAAPKKKTPHKYSNRQKQRALGLYVEVGPRQASRELKIPEATLRKWAKTRGLKPPTEHMNAGVRGQMAHMAERRTKLAEKLLTNAETFAERATAEQIAKDTKDVSLACAISIDKHIDLLKHDSGLSGDLPAVDRWLEHLKGET